MTNHPLTDEIIEEIWDTTGPCDPAYFGERHPSPEEMRAAYDLGYTQGLEDASDLITCLQRKDSPAEPITLEELEAMRPQEDNS